ncbi:hypothetical protein [Stenotrophomonas geniculata]|uniref:hypothetical protein n=1 Tax=Stenotrophomonas geniculata TaxID=86188 RepID=UPI00234EA8DE|nr:hypothetical protein [Stenotrophomonas geniculata]
MKNGDMPVAPMLNEHGCPHHHSSILVQDGQVTGLTKRELFAAMAMQGLLASGWDHAEVPLEGAETAVAYADHLLSALGGRP